MDVVEFLAWDAPGEERWQLVDGHTRAMAPASETHNIIQGGLGALVRNHLVAMGRRCTLVPNAGIVPHVQSDRNVRIPDLAVTCVRSRQEILVLHSTAVRAEMLRRDAEGNWPERPELLEDGTLELRSIGLQLPLAAAYAGTWFDPELPA
ncbi:MAG TPA: Uma2 family endonuclease [Acetobacteraceae bacterium]|nr:Uma2 family endonuclease [Acetobacteraceae bacterium]